MNKVTIKKVPFKLSGELITKGNKISFSALNRSNEKVDFSSLKGRIIISTFPALNTSVCDAQTQWIAKMASSNKDVQFLSLTTDSVETINEWCAAHGMDNVDIWSDTNFEFAHAANSLITKVKKLARGFMLVENGEIKDMVFNNEISADPNYETVEGWLK